LATLQKALSITQKKNWKKGELIAVVGESGSGKSTLGNILQKFYKQETGNIIINNKTKL